MTYNFEDALIVTSTFPFYQSDSQGGRGPLGSQDVQMGPMDDEDYFEYLFSASNISGDESTACNQLIPYQIRITGEQQYFYLWICDSVTPRVSVRNPSGNFKVGETVSCPNGATGTVAEWHRYRESNALNIIELDNPSGNFPDQVITGAESGATADVVAGYYDTPTVSTIGLFTINVEPLRASISGFYSHPKKVCYTKYLQPKCDTLVDVVGPVAEVPDATKSYEELFGEYNPDFFEDYEDPTDGKKKRRKKKNAKIAYNLDKSVCGLYDLGQEIMDAEQKSKGVDYAASRESTWPISVDTGVYAKVPILGFDEKDEPIPFKNKRNRRLEKKLVDAADKFWGKLKCTGTLIPSFEDQESFANSVDSLTSPASITDNYKDIVGETEEEEVITNKALEGKLYNNTAEMFRETRTYFCNVLPTIDTAIAANEYTDDIMNNFSTVVPDNWYYELVQKWCTHSFRTVPPAGEKIKWSVFEYEPHKIGTKVLDYAIEVSWYCNQATITTIIEPTPDDPSTPDIDESSPGGSTTSANPGYGASEVHTYDAMLTIDSNWSTYRDKLKETIEYQGNPDGDIKVAQIKEFMNTSEDDLIIFDYDAKDFPDFGYVELNNYSLKGQGIEIVQQLNPGLGYMNTPNVTIGEPDLENGRQATAEAKISFGRVIGYNITDSGTGYVQPPLVTIDAPDPSISITGDVEIGNRYILNVVTSEPEKIFLGLGVNVATTSMNDAQVLRSIPGVSFDAVADGTQVLSISSVQVGEEGFDLDDIQVGMLVIGTDDQTLTVQSVSLNLDEVTVTAPVAAGTYSLSTAPAIQLISPATVTLSGATIELTAPQLTNATATTRLSLGASDANVYKYEGSREIAHYDGKRVRSDGSIKLLNVLRERKQTTAEQHLRNDHTFSHIYV